MTLNFALASNNNVKVIKYCYPNIVKNSKNVYFGTSINTFLLPILCLYILIQRILHYTIILFVILAQHTLRN